MDLARENLPPQTPTSQKRDVGHPFLKEGYEIWATRLPLNILKRNVILA